MTLGRWGRELPPLHQSLNTDVVGGKSTHNDTKSIFAESYFYEPLFGYSNSANITNKEIVIIF